MKVLVIGGEGFVGSHTVKALAEKRHEVISVDYINGVGEDFAGMITMYAGNYRNYEFIDEVLKAEKIEAVFLVDNLAEIHTAITEPLKYYTNEVEGFGALLYAMHKNNVKHLIVAQTAPISEKQIQISIGEEIVMKPIRPIDEAKMMLQKMLKWAKGNYSINSVTLYYANEPGGRITGEITDLLYETNLIPIIFRAAENKKEVVSIFGRTHDTKDGTMIQDYLHVDDIASAQVKGLNYLLNGGQTDFFYITNGTSYTVKEVIKATEEISDSTIYVKHVDNKEPAIMRMTFSQETRDILNWKPKHTTIKEIMAAAWLWHKKYPTYDMANFEAHMILHKDGIIDYPPNNFLH